MTIRQYINEQSLRNQRERIEALARIQAPEIVIEQARTVLANLESSGVKVGGDQALLEREFTMAEVRKGNGGKQYLHFTTDAGKVNYFPNAKHGRFISAAE